MFPQWAFLLLCPKLSLVAGGRDTAVWVQECTSQLWLYLTGEKTTSQSSLFLSLPPTWTCVCVQVENKVPDGDRVWLLLKLLSDRLPLSQSKDEQGRERLLSTPLCRRHCATDFILNHYQKAHVACVIFFIDQETGAQKALTGLKWHSQIWS